MYTQKKTAFEALKKQNLHEDLRALPTVLLIAKAKNRVHFFITSKQIDS